MSEVGTRAVGELVLVEGETDDGGAALVRRNEHGMVSAEWAVGLIAAIAVAGVLLAVVTNGQVKAMLLHFILMVIGHFSKGL